MGEHVGGSCAAARSGRESRRKRHVRQNVFGGRRVVIFLGRRVWRTPPSKPLGRHEENNDGTACSFTIAFSLSLFLSRHRLRFRI